MNWEDTFKLVIEQAGMNPPAAITPGRMARFPGIGKSNGNTSGWAWLSEDGQGGAFGDWASDLSETWHAERATPRTGAERAAHTRRVTELQRIRHEEEVEKHKEAAQRAQAIWGAAAPATASHSYLTKKQIPPHDLRLDDENRLIAPVMLNGRITSLQYIDADGGKLFLLGGAVKGGSFTIGDLHEASTILLCEGYATGASLHEDTSLPVVVAFSAPNLLSVGRQLRQQYPNSVIIVAGDNDYHADGKPNTGLLAATETAKAIGGFLAVPEVMNNDKTDWNDVHVQLGLDAVNAAIEAAREGHTAMTTETNPTDQEAEVARLAALSTLDYGQARKGAAEKWGVPVSFVDAAVKGRRKERAAKDGGQGTAIEFEEIVPSYEPVEGDKLADRLAALFTRFAVLPDHGAIVLTLWTLFTYCLDLFQIAPRLDLASPEKRCGKTTVLSLLRRIAFHAVLASGISPSAIFRVIAAHRPTLLIDEMDTFIEANEELRGLLNSGHTRDAANIIRCDGDDHEPKQFSTWAAMAFAHIGKIPDTLEDRSIRLPMRRKLPSEKVTSLRQTGPAAVALQAELSSLVRQIVRWIEDHSVKITLANPSPIAGLGDRATDNWMPLLSIAEVLGGSWPEQALAAALALSGQAAIDNESIKVELLRDVQSIYKENGFDRMSSVDLCNHLVLLEERPWGSWKHGKPITPTQLARLVKPFGVSSRTVRFEGTGLSKGYLVDDFRDAFERYLSFPAGGNPLLKRNNDTTRAQSGDDPLLQGVTKESCYVSENGLNPAPRAECVSVTFQNPQTELLEGDL